MNKDVLAHLVGTTKRAAPVDFNLQQLEALRQNAVARHQTLLEGARQGGASAGSLGGAGAGGGLTLRALLPLLLKSKMSAGRKVLGGLAGTLGGATGGAMAGRVGGRAAGGASVPTLPKYMNKPVNPLTMTQVGGHLAKQALDFAAIRTRMEKTAFLGKGLRAAGSLFTRPAAAGPRQFSLGRTAATVGGTGYGTALAGHHTGLLSSDPTRGLAPEQKFRHHLGEYNQQASPLMQQIDAARAAGDFGKMNELMAQLEGGNFGGSGMWRNNALTRTLAPWLAGDRNAGFHQREAMQAQGTLQGDYDKAMSKYVGQPGQFQEQIAGIQQRLQSPTLMPQHRRLLQQQMSALQGRLQGMTPGSESDEARAIAQRMRSSGMQLTPFGGAPAAPPAQPGQPPLGQYKGFGGPPPAQGRPFQLNPNDFRDPWVAAGANGPIRGGV